MNTSVDQGTTSMYSKSNSPTIAQDIQNSNRKKLAAHLILASILFETAAFYSFEVNLASSLQSNDTFHWSSSHSSIASDIFDGVNLVSLAIFAVISDAKLSRAKTILIGFPMYLIGFIFMTLIINGRMPKCCVNTANNETAISFSDEHCFSWILPTIIVTAIGAGAVRSNIIAFGADQVQGLIVKSRYIDKFVVVIHIGSIIMMTINLIIPNDSDYFFYFYTIGASMLFISALLFLIGWPYYIHVIPYDSVVTNCIPVVANAFQSWRAYRKNKRAIEKRDRDITTSNIVDILDSIPIQEIDDSIRTTDERQVTFLDFAKVVNNGNFNDRIVEDVKSFRNAIITLILILPYKLCIYQFYTTFESQAYYMAYEGDDTTVTKVLFCEPVTVIIGIFILHGLIYKYLHVRDRSWTIATKFIISMCLAAITMCIAGGVEKLRQYYCPTDSASEQMKSSLSIYVQLPQDIGTGLAQLFAILANFEFAYFVAPRSAQSLFMSLHYISRVIGSYITDADTRMFQTNSSVLLDFSCSTVKKHEWRYFSYFFILAGILLLFTIIFIVCQRIFRLVKINYRE